MGTAKISNTSIFALSLLIVFFAVIFSLLSCGMWLSLCLYYMGMDLILFVFVIGVLIIIDIINT